MLEEQHPRMCCCQRHIAVHQICLIVKLCSLLAARFICQGPQQGEQARHEGGAQGSRHKQV